MNTDAGCAGDIEAADAAVRASLDPNGPEWDGCFGREAGTAASRGNAGPP